MNTKEKDSSSITTTKTTSNRSDKIYSILCIIAGIVAIPLCFIIPFRSHTVFSNPLANGSNDTISRILVILLVVLIAIGAVLLFIMSWRLHYHDHKRANWICIAQVNIGIGVVLCELMLFGVCPDLYVVAGELIFIIALDTYVDPALSKERSISRERKAERKKNKEQKHPQSQKQKENREKLVDYFKGGYIKLNFFNLFWIFTIASILGLIIETIFHMILFHAYQDRAGMLWGPFSPIYGFGAVIMTIALNHMHNKNIILTFLVSAVLGGAFEYFVSWFMQFAFGIVAWNYTGMWLSIGGRTCGIFMIMWGILGVVWIKLVLPIMEFLIKKIPWNWRYMLTAVCAILLLADGVMTLITIDCWYMREAGMPITNPIEQFCATYYDNSFMENRFQTMTMNPSTATRIS